MNIAQQIRHYRKAHDLTQEQIATALGVTAPAVNKWERGVSLPDIAILPALARLLEIDMNTLFSFHEALTDQETTAFVNALYARAMAGEIAAAFADAEAKLRDYPHDDRLTYLCATMLNAQLMIAACPPEEKAAFTARVKGWFERVSESTDANYRIAASYWLALHAIQTEDFEEAEARLQAMPDTSFDKSILAIRLLAARGQHDEAALQTEAQIMAKATLLHTLLVQLIEFEMKTGHDAEAQAIADTAAGLYDVLGLWRYDATSAQLVLALYREDTASALTHIRTILAQLSEPWQCDDAPLFYRLAAAGLAPTVEAAFQETFLRELQTQPEYDFLREDAAFQALLADAEKNAE